jgi:nucleoside-diphosphate-sugar epimerase
MKTAVVFGSTGMVGSELIKLLKDSDDFERIYLVNRRSSEWNHPKFIEVILDFDAFSSDPDILSKSIPEKVEVVFCSLGTTIKKAKSREAFQKVDFDYVVACGKYADLVEASSLILISAIASSSQSRFFYSQVKGRAEDAVSHLPLSKKGAIHFLRPSLLLGSRNEFRASERIAIFLSPFLNLFLQGQLKRYAGVPASSVASAMVRFAKFREPGVHFHENEELF